MCLCFALSTLEKIILYLLYKLHNKFKFVQACTPQATYMYLYMYMYCSYVIVALKPHPNNICF